MSKKTAQRGFLFNFIFSNNVAFVLEFGHEYIRFFAKHAQVVDDGSAFEVESPYTLDDLWDEENECCSLQVMQLADVMYLFCPNYNVKTLTRAANDNWVMEDWFPRGGPWENINAEEINLRPSAVEGYITITADANVFSEKDVGRLIRLTTITDSAKPWVSSTGGISSGSIMTSDGNWYEAQNGGSTGTVKPVHTEGTRSDGSIVWKYLHSGYGTAQITEYISATEVAGNVITLLPSTDATTHWEKGVFTKDIRPICGVLHKNRLAVLAEGEKGLACYLSCSGDYGNFADKEHGEILDESSITVPINSRKYHSGRWLCAAQVLFVGTSSGEFYIDAAASGQVMSPSNIACKQISEIGSKSIPPLVINGHVLFVDRFGTSIRDLAYSIDSDEYAPMDLTIMGRHLLFSGITNWAYQDIPNKIIWCIVGDGRLIGFTFNIEQQIGALHQHNLSGFVESLTVIPSQVQRLDDLWVSVRRIIAGVNRRYVEWLDEGTVQEYNDRIESVSDIEEREQLELEYYKHNAFFVDSGIIYNRPLGNIEKKISGLDHLRGMEVAIMADGAESPRQTISDEGTIEIDETDVKVTIGLPIKSTLIPQKMYIPTNTSQGFGAVQRISHLVLMLYRSGGGRVGESVNNLIDILYRNSDEEMGKSVDLFSGNKVIPWNGRSSTLEQKGANIVIYNDSVYPMHILAISPEVSTSDWG